MNSNGINGILPCVDGWGSLRYSASHNGIDIGWLSKYSKKGETDIVAWADGKVVLCGQIKERINGRTYYPTVVVLKHNMSGKTIFTRYWHLKKGSVKVKKNQSVEQGQVLGKRGNTGYSKGTHLHFELKIAPKGTKYSKASKPWSRWNVNPAKYTFVTKNQHWKNSDYKLKKCPVITITADEIRVRENHSTNDEIVGTVSKNERYEVYNMFKDKEYMWYSIGKDRWVADNGNWVSVDE